MDKITCIHTTRKSNEIIFNKFCRSLLSNINRNGCPSIKNLNNALAYIFNNSKLFLLLGKHLFCKQLSVNLTDCQEYIFPHEITYPPPLSDIKIKIYIPAARLFDLSVRLGIYKIPIFNIHQ